MFRLMITAANAAFQDDPQVEVGRILRDLGQLMEETATPLRSGVLRDENGNPVGIWEWRP